MASTDLGQSVSFGIKELPQLNYICADVNMETLVHARTYLSILTCIGQFLIRETAQNGQLESRHMGLGEKMFHCNFRPLSLYQCQNLYSMKMLCEKNTLRVHVGSNYKL